MKKTILTLLIALVTGVTCTSQKIQTERVFGGYKFTQNGNRLTWVDLMNTMQSNSEALKLIKKAKSNNTIASIIGGAGGALIGWPVGTAIGGGDPNWTLAGIGAGLIIIGIPISSSANKKAKQAVELYNSSFDSTSFNYFKPEFKVIITGNGMGLGMNF